MLPLHNTDIKLLLGSEPETTDFKGPFRVDYFGVKVAEELGDPFV
jgi:hypothetical protein